MVKANELHIDRELERRAYNLYKNIDLYVNNKEKDKLEDIKNNIVNIILYVLIGV